MGRSKAENINPAEEESRVGMDLLSHARPRILQSREEEVGAEVTGSRCPHSIFLCQIPCDLRRRHPRGFPELSGRVEEYKTASSFPPMRLAAFHGGCRFFLFFIAFSYHRFPRFASSPPPEPPFCFSFSFALPSC